MTRQRKSPRQRAEEALGIAQRKVKRLDDAITKAERELAALKAERVEAAQRLEYVQSDPALSDETLVEGEEGSQDG